MIGRDPARGALLAPRDGVVHPEKLSREIARVANVSTIAPWKGTYHRAAAMRHARDFLIRRAPVATAGDTRSQLASEGEPQ